MLRRASGWPVDTVDIHWPASEPVKLTTAAPHGEADASVTKRAHSAVESPIGRAPPPTSCRPPFSIPTNQRTEVTAWIPTNPPQQRQRQQEHTWRATTYAPTCLFLLPLSSPLSSPLLSSPLLSSPLLSSPLLSSPLLSSPLLSSPLLSLTLFILTSPFRPVLRTGQPRAPVAASRGQQYLGRRSRVVESVKWVHRPVMAGDLHRYLTSCKPRAPRTNSPNNALSAVVTIPVLLCSCMTVPAA